MSQTIHIRLDLSLTPRTLVYGITAMLLVTVAPELGSESVTLTTYYPAPSGVYTQMITTGNTWLARDSGSVGVGSTSTPGSKFSVNGSVSLGTYYTNAAPANGLIVSGNVGLGNTGDATYKLNVTGKTRQNGYIYISDGNCTYPSTPGGCGTTRYATWFPGIYVEGWSYQNRGGQVMVGGTLDKRVWARNTATSLEGWDTVWKNDGSNSIYCCTK